MVVLHAGTHAALCNMSAARHSEDEGLSCRHAKPASMSVACTCPECQSADQRFEHIGVLGEPNCALPHCHLTSTGLVKPAFNGCMQQSEAKHLLLSGGHQSYKARPTWVYTLIGSCMAGRAQARLAELGQHGQQLGVLVHRKVERRVRAAALERHHVVRLACMQPIKMGGMLT